MQSNAEAILSVSALFESFRPEYLGQKDCTDGRGRTTGRHSWLFKVRADTLAIVSDKAFPYSRPNVYILDYDATRDLPHVEVDGRLCLTKSETSSDPAETARQALAEALELLESHESGTEDDDLKEDFSNYWNQRQIGGGPILSLSYQDGAKLGAHVIATGDEIFAFSSRRSLIQWWENRNGCAPRHVNSTRFVELKSFPRPSTFPASSADLPDFLQKFTEDGNAALGAALSSVPNSALFVLVGRTPSGGNQFGSIRLVRERSTRKRGFRPKSNFRPRNGKRIDLLELLAHYKLQRLRTDRLDSAASRASINIDNLTSKKVIVVGGGALGSGVARMMAKAGVGDLELIDTELLGWENIRRHELGATGVRSSKSRALADSIRRDFPEIRSVKPHLQSFQELALANPNILKGADLAIVCTGSLHADRCVDDVARSYGPPRVPVVYGWMEAWGAAAHGVLLAKDGSLLLDGFEEGAFRWPASVSGRNPPRECGNATTPFGATEVAAAQAMISDLCLEVLTDPMFGDTWRTWWTSDRNLARVGSSWTEEFAVLRPNTSQSGIMERPWPLS